MLRNLSNSSTTSADRRENPSPSFSSSHSAGTPSKSALAGSSTYTKSVYDARSSGGFLNSGVKMGLMASFAILFLLVASSFANEEYSNDSTPLANLRGTDVGYGSLGGAKVKNSAAVRKIAPKQHAFSRSITEEGGESFRDEQMGAEEDGMANTGGTTLGSDLLSEMEQNLGRNKKDDQSTAAVKRMLVHSGNVSLQAPQGKSTEIADQISNLISKDGYVEDRSESLSFTHWSRKRDRKTIHMHLRVPSADFHRILDEIQGMVDKDHVLSVSSQSRDVTDEYIDASARADTLSASRDALKTILARANSVKDVMVVKTELGSMTEQIESLRRRAVYLKKQAVSCDFYILNICIMAISWNSNPCQLLLLFHIP